jgi:hypothetical protein
MLIINRLGGQDMGKKLELVTNKGETVNKGEPVNKKVEEIEEEEEEIVLFTVAISAQLKRGKAVKTIDFSAEITIDDLGELAYEQLLEHVDDEHKGWTVDDYEWEVVDEEE